ncbi:MAG: hypothetical protein QW222_07430 [Candidatus Bathyarchaeia archaeon]
MDAAEGITKTVKLGWEWLAPTRMAVTGACLAKPVPQTPGGRTGPQDPPALAPISPAAQNADQPKHGETAYEGQAKAQCSALFAAAADIASQTPARLKLAISMVQTRLKPLRESHQ